jgi:hypothetical protein
MLIYGLIYRFASLAWRLELRVSKLVEIKPTK